MQAIWRPMRASDIGDVIAIAAIVHPGYPEDDEVLEERLTLYAQGCFILELSGKVVGYLLSHPWVYGAPPKLNALLGALPQTPTTYYLHDIALLPQAQGQGAAGEIAGRLAANARRQGFSNMSLCAVNGSTPFWQRQGFALADVPGLDAQLASYGSDVRFMEKRL